MSVLCLREGLPLKPKSCLGLRGLHCFPLKRISRPLNQQSVRVSAICKRAVSKGKVLSVVYKEMAGAEITITMGTSLGITKKCLHSWINAY